jgi:tRNA modification GTPase
MKTFAAVMTGKGVGAISTIQVFGGSAKSIIKKIFTPAGSKPAALKTGKIYLGTISNGSGIIDQVTVGCESAEAIAIHCHGNPLIVADIMRLLQQHGAKLLSAEQLLAKILTALKPADTIALEAKLTLPRAKTIQGTKIIVNQINAGLSKTAAEWLKNSKALSLDQIRAETGRILKNSKPAKLIIYGCTAALIGPPNTGKSTLLNYLAGKQKAIVTDIEGTTRDWVSARCQIEPLSIELIDTAGLDEKLAAAPENVIEKKSQDKSIQILQEADLLLLVLDGSETCGKLEGWLPEKIAGRKILTVLNKSDSPTRLDTAKLPEILSNTVRISAKLGTGIENLLEKITQICGVADFDLQQPICFTSRQEKLLTQLSKAKSKGQAVSAITELLNGRLRV